MKRLFLLLSFLLIPAVCYGQISTSAYVTADDVTVAQMENNRTIMTNAINSADGGLLQDLSVTAAKLTANANPENRWDEAFSDFVFSGLLIPTSASLTSITPSGTAYIEGVRVVKDATSKTYTADRYTYVDLSKTGVYTYQETTFGATVPAISLNSIRLAKVSADSTTIPDVTDERTTSLSTIASADAIIDTAGKTGIQTQETAGEDILRFDTASTERMIIDANGIGLKGSTSGTTTITATATAAGTLTLPAATGTVMVSPITATGVFSWDKSTTGSQEITGVGFQPSSILFFGGEDSTYEFSIGADDGTTDVFSFAESATTFSHALNFVAVMDEGSSVTAFITMASFETDGFIVTKSKTGSPTGTAEINFIAFR